MNRKKTLQIIVPLAIILVIAGIWWMRNARPGTEPENSEPPVDNADFAFESEALDMEALKAYGLPIVVDFGADWCPPCRAFLPILKTAHAALLEEVIIKYVDTDAFPEIARDYPISAIPTQVLIGADGKPYLPSAEIADEGLSFTFYESRETGEHILTVHEGGMTEAQFYAVLEDMGVKR
jgi:thioredoxin 1